MSGEVKGVKRGPTPPGERIAVVDALRGFAILGILVVNMSAFKSAAAYTPTAVGEWTGALDRFVSDFLLFAAAGKFYLLFTFLFGLGFYLQFERARARGWRGPMEPEGPPRLTGGSPIAQRDAHPLDGVW
jgi:uncharacterized membrane protein YeiB